MNVSPAVRVFALAGLIAGLAIFGAFFVLGSGQAGDDVATSSLLSLRPAKPKAEAEPKEKPLAGPNGLPIKVERELARRGWVVVALWDPKAKVDAFTRDEAQAGAKDAGAGFAAINVTKREAGPLAQKLGVLRSPAVFIFTKEQSATPVFRMDGYLDRESIFQAALNHAPPRAGA